MLSEKEAATTKNDLIKPLHGGRWRALWDSLERALAGALGSIRLIKHKVAHKFSEHVLEYLRQCQTYGRRCEACYT